jgi:hypothetical protein
LTNTLIVEQHPCLVVEEIATKHPHDLIFTYSRYEVAPPGLQAEAPRTCPLRVRGEQITPDWVIRRFAELGPNEEMAWHSLVECDGVVFHIPMIDFVGRPTDSALCEVSRTLGVEMDFKAHLIVFDTERSFHGYFPDLIPERAWPSYLGQLLLLNEDNRLPIIDTRWVGHALRRGFAALRWSNNTNRYLSMPRLVPGT